MIIEASCRTTQQTTRSNASTENTEEYFRHNTYTPWAYLITECTFFKEWHYSFPFFLFIFYRTTNRWKSNETIFGFMSILLKDFPTYSELPLKSNIHCGTPIRSRYSNFEKSNLCDIIWECKYTFTHHLHHLNYYIHRIKIICYIYIVK